MTSNILCPICGSETSVVDSRPNDESNAVQRRRKCSEGHRFNTLETIVQRPLIVNKKGGRKEKFDREKLKRSILAATHKRDIPDLLIEAALDQLEDDFRFFMITGIQSLTIANKVMRWLETVDAIAYQRYASFYRTITPATRQPEQEWEEAVIS